ncbi:MAG: PD-(D/E)XK nuclease family protein, partial [Oscillospiraceae bacterium]
KLENARKAIVPRLTAFNTHCKGEETGEIIKEIYFLIKDFNLEENTLNLIEKQKAEGDTFAADDTLKMWDTTIDLLDALNDMLAGDEVLPQELDEFFVLLLRATEVGKSPRARQAVLFGQADRVRLDNVAHSFILGLNEGVFPAEVGFSGLLNHEDREALVQSGIEMPGAFENRVLLEDMFLYRALTSASQSVSLFYHKEGAGGGAEPSSLLCKLMETASFPSLDLGVEDFAATKSAALDVLGENYRAENELAPTLIKALGVNDEYKNILNKMEKEALNPQFSVTKTEVLGKIIGDEIKISPSRVESFYNCRFAYFLKVEPRRKAQMDVMQTGTFVHYILENAIKQGGANFAQLEKNDLEKIVADLCEKYMQEKLKGLEITKRMQSLLKRLCDNAVSLLLFIVEEQKQSAFKPIGFEVPIFDGEEIKPLEFKTN